MSNAIEVGGPYKESDDHVPNPTDMVGQYNTEGVGAHGKIEEVSSVFEVDKVKTAEEIIGALDPKNSNVSADRVLLPTVETDNEIATDVLLERAQARVEQGVVIGGATPAEREAALDGKEGLDAAVEQERQNAASNSTGHRSAGQHDGNTGPTGADGAKIETDGGTSADGSSSTGQTEADVKAQAEKDREAQEASKAADAKEAEAQRTSAAKKTTSSTKASGKA